MSESFILEAYIDNIDICDALISLYIESKDKVEGSTGGEINYSFKKATEIYINPNELSKYEAGDKYIKDLQKVINKYITKYPYSNQTALWGITENIKIQHYKINEGYFGWHFERNGSSLSNLSRHLSFITYLNDVTDDGETEFYYQKLKIKPEKGKTVIFPADWTHTHRGITSKTQDKYIITGWINLV